jgi:hypothetical protein
VTNWPAARRQRLKGWATIFVVAVLVRVLFGSRRADRSVVMRTPAPLVAALLLAAALVSARQSKPFESPLAFESSDTQLVESFSWARRQATAYAFQDDPVGPWFEAALPGREAFCMRDVAHQAMGAHALGLQAHVRNVLRRFAENISAERDWCSLWEIDRHNRPAHADYRNDGDFWYNLPANFDVLDAAWRMFLWSGDQTYLRDPVFANFYDRTVTDYVQRWSLGVDAMMKRPRLMNRAAAPDPDAKFASSRGIPGYNEDTDDFVAGLDLIAAQYAGFAGYARIQEARGDLAAARAWLRKAMEVKAFVNSTWWDEKTRSFYDHLTTGYTLGHRGASAWNSAALYWPVAADGVHLRATLDGLVMQIGKSRSAPIEEQSHHPEVLYRYGAPDVAYDQIMDLTRADRARREYPEVSFSVVGAIVTGLMGVSVDPVMPGHDGDPLDSFASQVVMTLPQIASTTVWAELRHLPVRANAVTVRHDGNTTTVFTNERGPALVWRAALPGRFDELVVNGARVKASRLVLPPGRDVSYARVVVAPGTSARVEAPRITPR